MKKVLSLFILLTNLILAQDAYNVSATFLQNNDGVTAEIIFDITDNVHVYASKDNFFEITDIKDHGLGKSIVTLPTLENYKDPFSRETVKVFSGKSVIKVFKNWTANTGDWNWKFSVSSQGCNDSVCFAPISKEFNFSGVIPPTANVGAGDVTKKIITKNDIDLASSNNVILMNDFENALAKFDVKNMKTAVGFMDKKDFLAFLSNDESEKNPLAGLGVIALIFSILLGGFLLNLTPCVLPMIPINLSIIGAIGGENTKNKGFLRGFYYGLGIAVVYGILGLAAAFGGASFGSLNSSAWFNFAIAIIFIALGLAMFDVFSIDFSRFQNQKNAENARSGKFLPVFFLGGISALLAGACVAPIVIAVILHAVTIYNNGNILGLFLPFLLGIGMALPWPFAGAGMAILPKPGMWMNHVKKIMAIFIFIMAIYYAYLGFTLLPAMEKGQYSVEFEIKNLTEKLEKAADAKKVVVIDFWATWCKNCLTMKATTLKDSDVKVELAKREFVLYQAEDFNNLLNKAMLDKFYVKGLPTYIILTPNK